MFANGFLFYIHGRTEISITVTEFYSVVEYDRYARLVCCRNIRENDHWEWPQITGRTSNIQYFVFREIYLVCFFLSYRKGFIARFLYSK